MRTLPPRGGEGRAGGERAALSRSTSEAPPEPSAPPSAPTPPSPTLPPSRGKGDHRYTRRAGAAAKRLRRTLTYTERLLWAELRKLPTHVRKQSPVGPYVADFLIHRAKLIIEVDGLRHDQPDEQLHDAVRDAWLAGQGYRVIRFRDAQVIADAPGLAAQVFKLTLPTGKGA